MPDTDNCETIRPLDAERDALLRVDRARMDRFRIRTGGIPLLIWELAMFDRLQSPPILTRTQGRWRIRLDGAGPRAHRPAYEAQSPFFWREGGVWFDERSSALSMEGPGEPLFEDGRLSAFGRSVQDCVRSVADGLEETDRFLSLLASAGALTPKTDTPPNAKPPEYTIAPRALANKAALWRELAQPGWHRALFHLLRLTRTPLGVLTGLEADFGAPTADSRAGQIRRNGMSPRSPLRVEAKA